MLSREFHRIRSLYVVTALATLVLLPFTLSQPSCFAKKRSKDSATVEPTILHMKEGMRLYNLTPPQYEEAADEFVQSCYFARNKYNPEGWLYLGRCYMKMKNWGKAIEALDTHLSQTTEKAPDANCDIAECYLEIGDFKKAERCITQARIEADYKNTRPYYTMGLLEERMGRYGEALGSFTTALGSRPWKYVDAWLGRARALRKMKPPDYKAAYADYHEMIEAALKGVSNENWVEIYYGIAECLYKRGDHQGAIDHLLEALKLNPDHFESHIALAHIFDEEKHVTSAVNQYEHAIRTAPKGFDTEKINKRILALQGQLKASEKLKEVKPSPYMREQEQSEQQQKPGPAKQLPAGESGF